MHFPFAVSYDPFDDGQPLVYEIGATPMHALCLPPPPDEKIDRSLRPSVLYVGDGGFGGDLQNFGHCAITDSGQATFTLRDAKGKTLYTLDLPPTVNTGRRSSRRRRTSPRGARPS